MDRWTRDNPCPICGGWEKLERGEGKRCWGFLSKDLEYAHCSRDELAGPIPKNEKSKAYPHWLSGPCHCGINHGGGPAINARGAVEHEALYTYDDEQGNPLFQVVRDPGKKFWQRRWDGSDWVKGVKGVRFVIYRLHELTVDDTDRPVYIVEGEKDVDNLRKRGLLATCNPGGANKWAAVASSAWAPLAGRDVIIIADADEDGLGRKHALEVQLNLIGHPRSMRLMEPPAPHKDVSDLLAAGGSIEDLVDMQPFVEMKDAKTNGANGTHTNGQSVLTPWMKGQEPDPTIEAVGSKDIYATLPPISWLVEAMKIAPCGATLFAGYGYSGKTVVAQCMALAVATGRKIFDKWDVRQGKVLHLDYEQGSYLTKERYQRMSRAMGIWENDVAANLELAVFPQLYLDHPRARDIIAKRVEGFALVITDSLRASAPSVDENASEVRRLLDNLNWVSERTGVVPLVIHHGRKPPAQLEEGASVEPKYSIRGSSAIFDASANIFVLHALTKHGPVRVTQEKERLRGKAMEEFGIIIHDVEHAGLADGALRVGHLDRAQLELLASNPDTTHYMNCERIMNYIRAQPGGVFTGNRTAMLPLVKIKRELFFAAMSSLESQGRISSHKHPDQIRVVTGTSEEAGSQVPSSSRERESGSGSPPIRGEPGTSVLSKQEREKADRAEDDADVFYQLPDKQWRTYMSSKPWAKGRKDLAIGVANERIRKAIADAEELRALLASGKVADARAYCEEQSWPRRRAQAALWRLEAFPPPPPPDGATSPPETPPKPAEGAS